MVSSKIKKGNAKLTLSINKDVVEDYKRHCEKNGMIISKRVERFMEEELKNEED